MYEISRKAHRGFTLIGLLLVLVVIGILAAIVMAMLSYFAAQTREAALRGELRDLRHQILAYQIQHGELPAPDQLHDLLVSRTTQNGQIDASGSYGPYMAIFPKNPYNGRVDVKAVPGGAELTADDTSGWLYAVNGSDFTIVANTSTPDRTGRPLVTY